MNYPEDYVNKVICGDCLEVLRQMPDESVNCCITSPPYWGLRDYGVDGQLGLEKIPEEYVAKLVGIFREVRRVLRDDGTLWLNLGDSYAGGGGSSGHTPETKNLGAKTSEYGAVATGGRVPPGLKPKDLVGIPWRVAFALQADCWYLRQDIIWSKPNPMPESVTDRCTKAHEYIFLLSKQAKYYYDGGSIKEKAVVGCKDTDFLPVSKKDNESNHDTSSTGASKNGRTGRIIDTRNRRSVWTVTTKPFREAHFATFPPDLIEPCVLAGCPENGIILDPFMGAGTTAVVSKQSLRNYIGIELNEKYIEMAQKRIDGTIVNKKLNFQ